MTTFDSTEALKREVLNRIEKATKYAEDDVYKIFEKKMNTYYSYKPRIYKRTNQLKDSLDKSAVEFCDNGYVAEVFFHDDWDYVEAPDDSWGYEDLMNNLGDRGWTNEEIIDVNMHDRSHGGYKASRGNIALWDDPLMQTKGKINSIFKKSLNKAGLSN